MGTPLVRAAGAALAAGAVLLLTACGPAQVAVPADQPQPTTAPTGKAVLRPADIDPDAVVTPTGLRSCSCTTAP